MTLRPLAPRIVVQMHPNPETVGSLVLPEGGLVSETVRTGTVLSVSDLETKKGRRVPNEDIQAGDSVAFIKYLGLTHTNQQVQKLIGDDVIVIEPKDVLLVMGAGEEDRVRGV